MRNSWFTDSLCLSNPAVFHVSRVSLSYCTQSSYMPSSQQTTILEEVHGVPESGGGCCRKSLSHLPLNRTHEIFQLLSSPPAILDRFLRTKLNNLANIVKFFCLSNPPVQFYASSQLKLFAYASQYTCPGLPFPFLYDFYSPTPAWHNVSRLASSPRF